MREAPALDELISRTQLNRALTLITQAVADGDLSAAATVIALGNHVLIEAAFGHQGWNQDEPPLQPEAPFLIASLTKPIVCAGAMLLVQEGLLSLHDAVAEFVPAFAAGNKQAITLYHLMTHTSGLPDHLDQNVALREQHAGLDCFIEAVCRLEPLFPPGTEISYQSMGLLMLGRIIEVITGHSLRRFLQERLFLPLGMEHTTLGLPEGGPQASIKANDSAEEIHSNIESDWGWNSRYWRDLGAPWGGVHATARDLNRFLRHILGARPGPLSSAARRAMVRDHTSLMPHLPQARKLTDRWGLGWRLGASACGELVSPQTFGHTGATGTVFWADPATQLSCVLLTNQPGRQRLFRRYGNAVAGALRT